MQSPWCFEAGHPQQVAKTWTNPVCSMKYTWECCTCLSLFWRICLTIGLVQGAISNNITKQVITLLKKGRKHVWEELDDYRPITLLNTDFGPGLTKSLAACHLWSDRTWGELCCKVKIDTRQLALGPRGVRSRHWSRADQFRSV